MKDTELHEQYMERCITLGRQAGQQGESPVGAVLVKDNHIVAEGLEAGRGHKDITFHAEIEVIRNLVQATGQTDLSDYTLYTTHEPCIMCAYVIRHHKINTVVWGISITDVGGYSSAYKILKDTTVPKWGSPPQVISGILEAACKALHR